MFVYLVRDKKTGKFYQKDGCLWDGKSQVQVPRVHAARGHATNSMRVHDYKNAEVVKFSLTEVSDLQGKVTT